MTAGVLDLLEGTSPLAPAAGRVLLYAKSDDIFYKMTSAGVESPMASGTGGTVTNTGGNLTANLLVQGNGGVDSKVIAGFSSDGISKLTLGVPGTSVGGLKLANATSGTVTIQPVTGALGAAVWLTPAASDTFVGKATTDIFTGKTFDTAGTGNAFAIAGVAVTANTGTGAIARQTSPSFTTPALGTPSGGVLTNCTGLPGSAITGLGTGVATFLATPSSANLAATVTGETGTGGLVFGTGPTIDVATLTQPTNKYAKPANNLTAVGDVISGYNAGATISQFQCVYVGPSGTWLVADANGSGTFPCRGIAMTAGTSGNPLDVLFLGIARKDSWTWTPNVDVWMSGTAGAITQTAPATSGDAQQKIGYAQTATELVINIGNALVAIAA